MTFDILIRNGEVVDGTGKPPRRADVGMNDGCITAVGKLTEASGEREVDASGRLVTPGFIDAHGHSDVSLYMNPSCETKVAQGITTEVMGNCGYSPFPLLDNNRGYLLDPPGVEIHWSTPNEYFCSLVDNGIGINVVPQVGHVTIRAAVLNREDRPATPAEIENMKDVVRVAMEAGACGLSTGLEYSPATASDLEEIVELVDVVAEYGGFYSSHIRGYSRNGINAVAEAIEVGRRTGVPVQISHLAVYGRSNWGRARRLLYLIDKARGEGILVACDMMAYPTSGAWWAPRAVLPAWIYDWRKPWVKNVTEIRDMLLDPDTRERVKSEIESNRERPKCGFDFKDKLVFSDWRDIYIKEVSPGSPHDHLLGMDLAAAASVEGKEPCDLFLSLILNEGEQFAAIHSPVGPQDFKDILTNEWTMFGTDANGSAISRLEEPWNVLQPHPRHYGTFPRVLARFVQQEGLLQLAEAVRRMSALPAEHFGLNKRGYIREDYWADLVVVNPTRVEERGTWRLPSAYPVGIEHVYVNGVEAISDGCFTGKLGGYALRHET